MLLEVPNTAWVNLAQGRAVRAEHEARQAERNTRQAIDEANGEIRKANDMLTTARRRIAELEDALAISKASHAGSSAQVKAFIAQHPDSPLRADSGKCYKDGDMKRRITLIYEAAFDAALSKILGISNPASRRAD